MKIPILALNIPTGKLGRVYTTEIIDRAIKFAYPYMAESSFFVYKTPSLCPEEKDIIGLVKSMNIEDDILFADIDLYSDAMEKVIPKGGSADICFRPMGAALDPTNVGDDYRILGLVIVFKPVDVSVTLTE